MMTVKILPVDHPTNDKVADAELHFGAGPLDGLKLVGFSIWTRRTAPAGYSITYPARTYSVNGEARSFALLRPVTDTKAHDALRELILAAWAEHRAAEQEAGR